MTELFTGTSNNSFKIETIVPLLLYLSLECKNAKIEHISILFESCIRNVVFMCPYDKQIEDKVLFGSCAKWVTMAQKHIRSAKILFEHDADNETVCFHCQQAVEKYFKGYLIYISGQLQDGHSLLKLCKKAMAHDQSFGSFLKDMAFVNTFYIETRYPAQDPLLVSKDDTEECLRIVESVVMKIDKLLSK